MTYTEQMNANDVVVVAKLLEVPPPSDDPTAEFPKAEFEIVQVIKGTEFVSAPMKFRTQLVGTYPIGQKFLVMGVDPPKLAWTTPMKATERVFKYLKATRKLPESGPQRLVFFQDYFEDAEAILAFDAYDEFANAPYDDLIAMKDQMQRDKLVGWILDPETSINRRRLYFTMLGVCGTKADIKMLEDLIRSGDRKKWAGLDALIASYLTLAGEPGVDLIEETFLADPEVDYLDANAAVSALRFHGTEVDQISKSRIVKAVRHILDRPKMADMIIPDLARWEDWSVMERLVQMFKDADEESNWLRVPVINYLQACPDPKAKTYIAELAKIDPEAVERAQFFAGGFGEEETDDAENDLDTETTNQSDASDASNPSESSATITPAPPESETGSPIKKKSDLGDDTNHEESKLQSESQTSIRVNDDELGFVSTDHRVLKIAMEADGSATSGDSRDAKASGKSTSQDKNREAKTNSAVAIPTSNQKTETKIVPATNRSGSVFVSNSSGSSATPVPIIAAPIESAPLASSEKPNLTWSIVFVPMGISLVIFLLMWSVVNGWFERLIF